MSLIVAAPMDLFITLFKPFVWLLMISSDKLLCAFNVKQDETSLVHSTEELDMLVDASYNEGVCKPYFYQKQSAQRVELVHRFAELVDIVDSD